MEQACRVLKISRSGCYGRARRNPCSRKRKNQTLQRRLMEPHQNDLALGLDNLCHLLKPEFGCPRKHVHRQMRLAGIASVKCRACKVITNSRHNHPIASNLLKAKLLFWATKSGLGAILPAFPPERAGSIRPSSRACVPAKGWAVPFSVLLIPRRLWKRWTG